MHDFDTLIVRLFSDGESRRFGRQWADLRESLSRAWRNCGARIAGSERPSGASTGKV